MNNKVYTNVGFLRKKTNRTTGETFYVIDLERDKLKALNWGPKGWTSVTMQEPVNRGMDPEKYERIYKDVQSVLVHCFDPNKENNNPTGL